MLGCRPIRMGGVGKYVIGWLVFDISVEALLWPISILLETHIDVRKYEFNFLLGPVETF